MRFSRSGRVLAACLIGAVVVLAVFGYAFRSTLGAWAIPKIAGAATGTSVSFGGMQLHGRNATFTGVNISSHAGQEIAYIPRVYITYSLRDLLPGSKHRFGLSSIVVDHPQITIVHNRDGTYNIPKQKRGPAVSRQAAPLNFTAKVIDGTLTMIDFTRVHPDAQHLYVDNVNVDAVVNSAARTHYVAAMNYREGSRLYPIHGKGAIDESTGFTLHHWTAARVPLPRLLNYGVNNANIDMLGGALEHLDLRYFGKVAASAYMSGVKARLSGVSQPVRDGHGELDVYEGGLTTRGLYANVGTMPVRVTGGITDLAHPVFRLAVNANGDLASLKTLVPSTAKLPMSGAVAASMMVEGSMKQPQVLLRLRSPLVRYRGTPIDAPHGLIAFDGQEADVLSFDLTYNGFAVGARGRMALHPQTDAVEMIARLDGPSGALPYAASMLPGMTIGGTVLATGNDLKRVDTHGIVQGSGNGETLAAIFNVDSRGTGTVAPFAIEGPGRSLYGEIALDRPHDRLSALASARHFPIALPRPAISGTLTGDVYAQKRGNALGMLGDVDVRDASYGKIQIAEARARFTGGVGNVRVSSLAAHGSFGTLNAAGTIDGTNRVALEGRFNGSLSQLSRIAGNLPASGTVDAPIALVYDGGKAIAQIHDAQFRNADVRGVPLEGLSATIGTQGKNVRVYAAQASIAQGGHARASGTLGGGMAVAVSNVKLAALHGAGVPVTSGDANFAATVQGPLNAPDVRGALLVTNAAYRNIPVSAESAFAYAGDTLRLNGGVVGAGPAFVTLDGAVGGVRSGTPQYDLDAALRGADAHSLVALAQPRLNKQYIEGTIDANVHVGGAGRAPAVSGAVSVPAGSVHGLAFRDLHGTLSGTAQNFALQGGHVQVGSTALAFEAAVRRGAMDAALRAPHADLADFNDYFDTGDTFAGNGSLALEVNSAPGTLISNGNVDLQDVRFRRFEIGTTSANWSTRGNTIDLVADVGGASGRGHVAGSVTLGRFTTLADAASTANSNVVASVTNADLGTWLPMLGLTAPVTGTLDATARVNGRFPDETIAADASVNRGTFGRVQMQRAHISVRATRGRGRIENALVQIPFLTATGSGTFGLHARDPLDLAFRATSPDIGKLYGSINGKTQKIAGALDTTLHVTGTRLDPAMSDSLTLTSLQYDKLTVPAVSARIDATPTYVTLSDGLIQLQRGNITASGYAPIAMKPHFELDPHNAPVRLALNVNNVDFSNFENVLPQGTHLAGTFGGAMTINGTVDNPLLNGTLALHNGYFVGPIDQNPIRNFTGQLAFNGTTLALYNLHANVGGGTLDLNGRASVPDVRDIRDATFHTAIALRNAQFNSPKYFRGKVDANITADRATPKTLAVIAGTVNVPSARIPLTAFWNPRAPQGPAKKLPDIALNVRATIGNDVRVQSSNVDVGAQGAVTVGGTLPSPTLGGAFTSTGGSVDFFRRFTIESADVRFDPSNGIMPYVNATATTQVPSPQTYIALNVSGLAPDNLQIAFSSDPSYDRAQIMGLLAGVTQLNNLGQGGGIGGFSVGSTVQNLAAGELNTFFTREMLEPLSASLGNALGLQNLQLTDDFHSGFGFSAVKAFGKHVTASYRQSLGTPSRQMLNIEAHRGDSTAFALMLYQVQSPALLGFQQTMGGLYGYNSGYSDLLNPTLGTHGVSLLYEHKFQ